MGDYGDRWLPEPAPGTSGTLAISGGLYYSLALAPDGTLIGVGGNGFGELATGVNTTYPSPILLGGTAGKALSAGEYHSLHLNVIGNAFSTGYGGSGRLAVGTTSSYNAWQFLGAPLTDIAGSNSNSYFTTAAGTLLAAGYNGNGQIGDGTVIDRLSPTFIPGVPYCSGIAQGHGTFMAALTNPPVMASALKVSPITVVGGANSIGTVTLTAAAGPGGLVVKLSSNKAQAIVPATVTVAPGAKTATFTINTSGVGAVTVATITANLVINKTATLTINP